MLIDIEKLSRSYLTHKSGLQNGIIANPFWVPGTVSDMMDYSAEIAAKCIPLEYLNFSYPYQRAFQRVLKTGVFKNKRNLLFLIVHLTACGHIEYTVKLTVGLLKHLKGKYKRKIIYALAGHNSVYLFMHIKRWDDELMSHMIDRLPITDVKYHPAMKKIYNIIKRNPLWVNMFISHYNEQIRVMLTRKIVKQGNDELILSMIRDVDGFSTPVDIYIIDKINDWITISTVNIWINKLCELMKLYIERN